MRIWLWLKRGRCLGDRLVKEMIFVVWITTKSETTKSEMLHEGGQQSLWLHFADSSLRCDGCRWTALVATLGLHEIHK